MRESLHNLLEWFKHNPFLKFLYRLPFAPKLYHRTLSFLGAMIYGFPSDKIFVIGVTGTKGKSTTIELINAILENAGNKTAVLSSIRTKIGEKSNNNAFGNTMAGRFLLQDFLRKAVVAGCKYAVVEVTSQGVEFGRHCFIDWKAAVFTNLAPEHIESHGSFEKYRDAKVRFFKYVVARSDKKSYRAKFFINKDDGASKYFSEAAQGGEIISYGASDLPTKLPGDFNKYNIGAAVALGLSLGLNESAIAHAIAEFSSVPGRMEFVQKSPFAAVVDYAHTPDSLQKVYSYLKSTLSKNKKLICVLGATGGGRDKWKRSEMGKIAAEYCNEIILTNEDPFDENPEDIMKEIKSGILSTNFIANTKEILDRREALKEAVSLAETGDVVVATGKGTERYIRVRNGKKIPWNERGILEDILGEKV